MRISFEIPDSEIEAATKRVMENLFKTKYDSKDLPDIKENIKKIIINSSRIGLEELIRISIENSI